MNRPIRVLTIDGGGIRGIIPGLVLAALEECAGKPIAAMFDLIAGTSTGALLALGLNKPDKKGKPEYSARELVKIYEEDGVKIFHRSLWKRLRSMELLIDEKYPVEGISQVLGGYFGECRLSEAIKPVLVTAYEMEQRDAFFFKSYKARKNPSRDYLMIDVGRAAAAAPTFFEPAKIVSVINKSSYVLVDGGVFANNPGMCAYVEANKLFAENFEMVMLSLGTGVYTRPYEFEEIKNWGLIKWAQPILNVVFDGVADTVNYQLSKLLTNKPDGTKRYYRMQLELSKEDDLLDNASEENIGKLKKLAEELIRENKQELEELCGLLK